MSATIRTQGRLRLWRRNIQKDVPFVGDLDGCRSCEQKKSKDYGAILSTEVRLADLRLHKSFAT